jgi:cytochrome c
LIGGRDERGIKKGVVMPRLLVVSLSLGLTALVLGAPGARAQDAGAAIFKKNCALCHSTKAGENKIGPSLAGVIGRKAGSVPGYNYSDANKKSGDTWDEATLDTYLTDPRKFVPGTKMVFVGLKSPDDRKALIAFLKEQKE